MAKREGRALPAFVGRRPTPRRHPKSLVTFDALGAHSPWAQRDAVALRHAPSFEPNELCCRTYTSSTTQRTGIPVARRTARP